MKSESKFWEKKTNGWVFLSHSFQDYEEVKIIRNYLEENNFNALIFFLKCFDDDRKKNEVKKLNFYTVYHPCLEIVLDIVPSK